MIGGVAKMPSARPQRGDRWRQAARRHGCRPLELPRRNEARRRCALEAVERPYRRAEAGDRQRLDPGMNWLTKASSSLKALTSMRHAARPMFLSNLLRRTRFDYRKEVGDGLDSSVVTAPIRWVQRALPEAKLTVRKRKADGNEESAGPPAARADPESQPLLRRPGAVGGDGAQLVRRRQRYWIKVRNGVGRVGRAVVGAVVDDGAQGARGRQRVPLALPLQARQRRGRPATSRKTSSTSATA
jgi:hypothetical protein